MSVELGLRTPAKSLSFQHFPVVAYFCQADDLEWLSSRVWREFATVLKMMYGGYSDSTWKP